MHNMTLSLLFFLAACAGGEDVPTDVERAAELWQAIDGFSDWGSLDGWGGVVPSEDGTHGPFVQIWADGDTLAALTAGDPVPDGGIIVKCGFQDESGDALVGGDGHALTAMQKIAGYDPDHGDWFWAKLSIETGEVDGFAGAEAACYGCHSSTDADGDFVIFDDLGPADTGS
jgi:hypothetical protein